MRILIVEDEPALGKLLKENLEAEAYAVDLEMDGERGLQRARANDYDAIVLEDILPGRCGSEICEELRRRGRTTPILFMSMQCGTDKKVHSLDSGADDYLAKPFAYAEMSARLRALLRRPALMRSEKLRVGDLVLDLGSESVVCRGKRADLTTKEYALLRYMMANAGRLLTRAMIFDHVWSEETNPLSNMIETHIYNLRRKIDGVSKRGRKTFIKTISGRGYVLTK